MWFCIVVSSGKGVLLSDFSLVSRHGTLYNLTRPHPEPLQKSDLCIRHHRWVSAVWNTGMRGAAKNDLSFFSNNQHSIKIGTVLLCALNKFFTCHCYVATLYVGFIFCIFQYFIYVLVITWAGAKHAGCVQTWFALHWFELVSLYSAVYTVLSVIKFNAKCQPESTAKGNWVALPSSW